VIAVLFAEDGPGADALPAIARMGFSGAHDRHPGQAGARLHRPHAGGGLASFVAACREHGLMSGLAGSLGVEHIPALAGFGPTYLGFRGGSVRGGDRRAGTRPRTAWRGPPAASPGGARPSSGPRERPVWTGPSRW
jgi:hypothetical protein